MKTLAKAFSLLKGDFGVIAHTRNPRVPRVHSGFSCFAFLKLPPLKGLKYCKDLILENIFKSDAVKVSLFCFFEVGNLG